MRTIKIFVILLLIGVFNTGCLATLLGGASGALIGRGLGGKKGTALGAGLGLIAGSAVDYYHGRFYRDKGENISRTPLPWIKGERTAVFVDNNYWGEPLRAIVEEYLRGQGAIIVATPGRRYNNRPEDLVSAVYIAELYTERKGDYAVVQVRIIDRTNDNVRATASDKAEIYNSYNYGSGGDYKSFEIAANRALSNLH